MASTHKHLRSSTANKRPTTAIADGQIALNTNTTSPGLFFKDSTGATIIKVGPVHIGSTAPNATPPSGGSSGNSTGEVWLDTSLTPNGVKIWDGSAWVNATPIGSTTVQGLLELATNAETQTGSDTARAVTPAGLQSKLSDSTSTTSSTTIASSTAVKAAYDLANAALPLSGGTVTGNLEIGSTGSLSFEGSTVDAFETTIAVTDPTADRTITLPDTTGTIVTTGDTGTITSTMILDGTIVNGDINASAAIAHTKLANITAGSVLMGNPSNVPTATALTGDVTVSSSGVTAIGSGKVTSTMILDGTIVNADVNASAAIAGTKISPDFGSQNTTTTGTSTAASFIPTSSTAPSNGVYLPSANNVAISTNGQGRLFVDASGNVGVGNSTANRSLVLYNNSVAALALQNSTTGTAAGDGFQIQLVSADGYVFNYENAPIIFGTNSTERLRITSTGALNFVGAGTAGSTQAVSFNGSAPVNSLVIDSSGRVGLGTSSPSGTLEVGAVSGAVTAGDLTVTTGSTTATVTIGRLSSTGNDNTIFNIRNRVGTSTLYMNSGDGRLGIGTNSPSALLDVVGNSNTLSLSSTSTDATTKEAKITCRHYTNSEENAMLVYGASTSTDNAVILGGGSSAQNCATYIQFITAANNTTTSGTERARIDSSGRLLVGTSSARSNFFRPFSATAAVQIEGTSGNLSTLSVVRNSNDSSPSYFVLGKSRGTANASNTIVQSGDAIGSISFQGTDGGDLTEAARISAEVDGTPGTADMPGRLIFSTTADGASSPTERMRIDNTGTHNMYSINDTIYARTNRGAGTSYVTFAGVHSATSTTNGTASCYIYSNGNIQNTNGSYTTLSDVKLKENIVDAGSQWDDLKAIQIRNWNFKEETGHETHRQIGPIAQELEQVCPGLVFETPDRDADGNETGEVTKGVNQSVLYMKAVKALQEAMERIEALEAKVAALEAA